MIRYGENIFCDLTIILGSPYSSSTENERSVFHGYTILPSRMPRSVRRNETSGGFILFPRKSTQALKMMKTAKRMLSRIIEVMAMESAIIETAQYQSGLRSRGRRDRKST